MAMWLDAVERRDQMGFDDVIVAMLVGSRWALEENPSHHSPNCDFAQHSKAIHQPIVEAAIKVRICSIKGYDSWC